jgi:hypothetical protein
VIDRLVVSRIQERRLTLSDALHDVGHDRIASQFKKVPLLEFGEVVSAVVEPSAQFGRGGDLLGPEI